MYIPKINSWDNIDEILEFVDRFSFGILISMERSRIIATHIPILCERQADYLKLEAHIALSNTQWKEIEGQEVLVIFSEPHAYISPSNYTRYETVPTWNYLAVHMYGRAHIVEDVAGVNSIMERTMVKYEPAYHQQWEQLSDAFKKKMLKGIVSFRIDVTEVQAKAKMSQNKSDEEIGRIISDLKDSTIPGEALLAEYMQKGRPQ
jgi:transcriptional regulator